MSRPRLHRGSFDCAAQAKQAKDQLLRSLADMENLRQRSAQQIDTNRKFAVQVCQLRSVPAARMRL